MPAVEQLERGPGNGRGQVLGVGRWGDAVVDAAANERRADDLVEPVPCVVAATGIELEGGPFGSSRFVSANGGRRWRKSEASAWNSPGLAFRQALS